MTSGTVNGGDRGNTEDRRRRREWLVATYQADEVVVYIWDVANGADPDGPPTWTTSSFHGPGLVRLQTSWGRIAKWVPACRCYRCGTLLTADTVTPDRIIPGCLGGTYRRNNIRPACQRCQSITGNQIKRTVRGKP